MSMTIEHGNFTGGSLLIKESRLAAKLWLANRNRKVVVQKVLAKNLFQNSSKATTQKYCQLILNRLNCLSDQQIGFIVNGADELARLTLMAAVLKLYPLIFDFMQSILAEKVQCFETHLNKADWTRFLDDKAREIPEIKGWSEVSRCKMGQVVIRMLAEAGFLDNTRKMRILLPHIPLELEQSLVESGNGRVLAILKLGR